jgi:5-formyltetrahydrofolate cyclo-ligase
MSPNNVPTKDAFRLAAKAARAKIAPAVCRRAAEVIASHGLSWLSRSVALDAVVSGYLAFGDELDPGPLLDSLHRKGHRLCLPVMQGRSTALIFRCWRPGDALTAVQWGIREPLRAQPELVPDVVLVPLLAFDKNGQRLGYGGGYYDRTLAALRTVKPLLAIGLAFDEQEVDAVPHLDYDQKLDGVLTPSGGRLFS